MKTAIISPHAFDRGCNLPLDLSHPNDVKLIQHAGAAACLASTNGDLKGA